jgi:5'-AMP-activated protein kinase catalytic alpha subunit
VHRDIKCENILLTGTSRRTVLLADFGFAARYVKGKNALSESYGSLYYSSPEIVEQVAYEGPEVDVWSMGVVLYSWASGRLPFGGTKEEIAARIKSGSFMMQTSFSQQLRDLISRMLDVNPASRATIADIRKHEWFTASTVKAGMPANTSEGNITRWFAAQEHRRRNSDITLKKPSSLSKIVNIPFGRK